MFDLAVLERPVTQCRAQPRPPRGRTAPLRPGARARQTSRGAHLRRRAARRRRAIGPLAVRRRVGRVDRRARRTVRRPGVHARGDRQRGARSSPTPPAPAWQRLAALDGLVALGVDAGAMVVPARLDRHRPAAARDDPRLVLASVEPRELRAAARARRRARPRQAGRLPRLGRQDRAHDPRAGREGRARRRTRGRWSTRSSSAGANRSSRRWRSRRRSSRSPRTTCSANWFENYGERPAAGDRALLRVRVRGRDGHRLHRPHRTRRAGRIT